MTRQERIDKLIGLGWIPKPYQKGQDVPDQILESGKNGYAQFHGVANDWPSIEASWQLPRCSLPDVLPVSEELNQWPDGEITLTVAGDLPPLTRQQFKDAAMEAMSYWEAVAGLKTRYVDDPNQARIVMTTGVIDQSGGTLAWSELPQQGTRRVTQKYDTREQWIISANPTNGIDLVRVACHELGHALGMGHISNGNLLAPIYSKTIRKPQAGDIQEMRSRYGKPINQPGPSPEPTPNPGDFSMIGILIKLLPFLAQFGKYLPELIKYMPQIIALIEELSKLFKTNPQALDAFVAELKAVNVEEMRLQVVAAGPQALTADDIFNQVMAFLRSIASAVGVNVDVNSGTTKVLVDVHTKREADKPA